MEAVTCTKCKETKDRSEFAKSKRNKRGLRAQCKACDKAYTIDNKEILREKSKIRWAGKDKSVRRNNHVVKRYGITLIEFNELLKLQDHKCKLCGSDTPRAKNWNVDHDHLTGRIRGILCSPCNTALGLFKENRQTLARAIAYLRESLLEEEDYILAAAGIARVESEYGPEDVTLEMWEDFKTNYLDRQETTNV